MNRADDTHKVAGISSAAVRAKTGRGWDEWIKILDTAGARKMSHTEIAAHLYRELEVPGWWSQMVAVGYEQARGLRRRHQTASGFQASSSKTIGVPVARLFAAWQDARARARWLGKKPFTIRQATSRKSMRITWVDGKTRVDVNFYPKGASKSLVSLEHRGLSSAREVTRMKAYWSQALSGLKEMLEV